MPYRKDDTWRYYSDDVAGYVDKYSREGMRQRNARLLRMLGKATGPDERKDIRDRLVENNLPLAKRCAQRYCDLHPYNLGNADDAFSDCCLYMTEFMSDIPQELIENPSWFQTRLYRHMYAWLHQRNNLPTVEVNSRLDTFDEEDFPKEAEQKVNGDFLKYVILNSGLLSERNGKILADYYFGDVDNYIEPCDLEMMSLKWSLTRERVRQVVKEAEDTLTKIAKHNLYHIETFYD